MNFAGQVWNKFSAIDVKPLMDRTGSNINYVSWSKLWTLLMSHYPASYYEFEDKHHSTAGTATMVEVFCSLTIIGDDASDRFTRTMWLPVMESYGQFLAIENPSVRQISDARMRCLVKCAAMFGLGLSAWSGDDYKPDKQLERQLAFNKKKSSYRMKLWQTAMVIKEACMNEDPTIAAESWFECEEDEMSDLWLAETKGGFFTTAEKAWIRQVTTIAREDEHARKNQFAG